MGEGIFFYFLAGAAVLSAVAVVVLRRPLHAIVASLINLLTLVSFFVVLQAPLVAIVHLVVVALLFLATLQVVRNVSPARLRTRRIFSFGQVLGLIISFFLGIFVLLKLTTEMQGRAGLAEGPDMQTGFLVGMELSAETWVGAIVAGLILLTAFLAYRLMTDAATRGSS